MQISGRGLQILMTEQKLDGAQVGAGFQQVSGPAMSNQVRACGLTDACLLGGLDARLPHRLVADGPLAIAMHARRKQVVAGLEPAPVGTQGLQQRRAEGKVAVLVALAVDHVDNHALAVDIGDLQPGDLGAAHACAVENHQQRALEQAAAGLDETRHFLPAEDVGQLPAHLGIRKELTELVAVERAYEKEPQCGHVVLNRSRAEFSLLEQIGLVTAQMVGTELVRGLAEMLREPFDETQITPDRPGAVVATLELFEHDFA